MPSKINLWVYYRQNCKLIGLERVSKIELSLNETLTQGAFGCKSTEEKDLGVKWIRKCKPYNWMHLTSTKQIL